MKPTNDEIAMAVDEMRVLIPSKELPNRSETREFIGRLAEVLGLSEDEVLMRFANHYQRNQDAIDALFVSKVCV